MTDTVPPAAVLFRALADHAPDLILTLDADGRLTSLNPAFERLTGAPAASWVGQLIGPIIHPADLPSLKRNLQLAAGGDAPSSTDVRIRGEGGDYLICHLALVPVGANGHHGAILGLGRDVTELRRLQVGGREAARTDHLTGLLNRRGAQEALEREVARGNRENTTVGIVLFDIDHFKKVNDTFGHEAGDTILRAVAGALRGALRPFDIAGRWGGEELIAILPGSGLHGARQSAERVRADIAALDGLPTKVTISAGTAEWTRGQDGAAALARADSQLYAAKTGGRNRVC